MGSELQRCDLQRKTPNEKTNLQRGNLTGNLQCRSDILRIRYVGQVGSWQSRVGLHHH